MPSNLRLCGLTLLVAGAANAADAPNEMRWLAADISPSMIQQGPHAGTGFLDLAMADMRKLLPGYKHSTLWGNVKRQEEEMQNGSHTCTVALLRTPRREAFITYSHPYFRILPIGIITLQSLAPGFNAYRNQDGLVSLKKAANDSNHPLGIAFARVYGGNIDKVINSGAAKRLVVRSGGDISEGLYDMLQQGRIDYLLGYAVEESSLFHSHPKQNPPYFCR